MHCKYIYPLKLSCVCKETIWGGDKLSKKFGKGSYGKIGETWELSVRDAERSVILNGICKGIPLGEYLDRYTDISSSDFPLLIKFIDANDKLSVQVHPDNEHALSTGENNGKTEMWYIIEAEENASIVYGVSEGTGKAELKKAVEDATLIKHLKRTKVSAGEAYFIPGGLVHAIGSGILLAEIQQNSDTTYRFYDYDRKDANGKARELHVDKALDAFIDHSEYDIRSMQFSKSADHSNGGDLLASCEYFRVSRHTVEGSKRFESNASPFISLLCLDGEGYIKWQDGSEHIQKGDSFFIPKALEAFELCGKLTLLETTV